MLKAQRKDPDRASRRSSFGRRGRAARSPLTPVLVAALLLTTLAWSSSSQAVPCRAGPCLERRPAGTHFLVEVNGGTLLNEAGGKSLGGLLGVGGKLPYLPLRFYLVGEAGYDALTQSVVSRSAGSGILDERNFRDLALGLRIYLPVYGPLRLFGEGLLGGSHVTAQVTDPHGLLLGARGWHGLGTVAGGLQLRLMTHLSLGLRVKLSFCDDGLSDLPQAAGLSQSQRTAISFGLTGHF